MKRELFDLLDDIERRIDPDVEDDFLSRWRDFLYDRFDGDIFAARRRSFSSPAVSVGNVMINDAFDDIGLMLYSQLAGVSAALDPKTASRPASLNLSIRANYGTGILSSMFGAELFMMPYDSNTLPTTKPLIGEDAMKKMLDRGVPDLRGGLGGRVLDFGEYAAEIFSHYPKISKYVTVYHPDLQGPLDICDLLFGERMFYAVCDDPDLLHGVLSLITDTYAAFMDEWYKIFPRRTDMNPHWANTFHRGALMIRNDSAVNLSPEAYREFSVPYDTLLFSRFGGGAVHFCGRGDHFISDLCSVPGLYAINLTQPHLNDMEKIYKNTADRGIKLIAFDVNRARRDAARGFNHCVAV